MRNNWRHNKLPWGVLKVHLPEYGRFPAIELVELYPVSHGFYAPGCIPYINGEIAGIGVFISRKDVYEFIRSGIYVLLPD